MGYGKHATLLVQAADIRSPLQAACLIHSSVQRGYSIAHPLQHRQWQRRVALRLDDFPPWTHALSLNIG